MIGAVADRIDSNQFDLIHYLNVETYKHDAVYVLDGIFELFILVGKQARNKRQEIRLAISFAQVSKLTS